MLEVYISKLLIKTKYHKRCSNLPTTMKIQLSHGAYLLRDINKGEGRQLGEGVQGDDDHGGGGIRVDQVLEELSAAGCQAGIMVHVLQHGNQLQLQFHWCVQTWGKGTD